MASTTKESAEKGYVKLTLAKYIRNIQNMALFYHSTNKYICMYLGERCCQNSSAPFPFQQPHLWKQQFVEYNRKRAAEDDDCFPRIQTEKLINK